MYIYTKGIAIWNIGMISVQEIGLYAWVVDDKYFSLSPLKIIFYSAQFYHVVVMHWNEKFMFFKSWNDQSLKYEAIQGYG